MVNLTLYGLSFSESGYFQRGMQVVLGRYNNILFTCVSKSGSQNLWLPFVGMGLKIFHPKGPSGTLEKAQKHHISQQFLWEKGLAPEPHKLLELSVSFESLTPYFEREQPVVWNCYGLSMERVFNGGRIVRNLIEKFGCANIETGLLDVFGIEALTLRDYGVLCTMFGGNPLKVQEMINNLKASLPKNFDMGPDLLTPSNIVLDHKGECKLIDFDHCTI